MNKFKTVTRDFRDDYLAPEALILEISPERIVCVSSWSIQELEEGEDVFTWQ